MTHTRYLPGVQRLQPDSNGDPRWRWGCWEITHCRPTLPNEWPFWLAVDTETPDMPFDVGLDRTLLKFEYMVRDFFECLFDLGPEPLTAAEVAELDAQS